MENDKHDNDTKEKIINFALLIQQMSNEAGKEYYDLKVRNDGIPEAEVILILETWLERYRRKYKGTFLFGEDDDNKE